MTPSMSDSNTNKVIWTADVLEKNIYLEETGPLSERIDVAWAFYADDNVDIISRKRALQFLIYAFDLKENDEINTTLIALMAERNRYKQTNPEYIPGRSPNLPFDMTTVTPKGSKLPAEVNQALASKELLSVNDESREKDKKLKAIYLDKVGRAKYQVHINNGSFVQNGKLFDTSTMMAHGKLGYGAFTLNINGELSVFNHFYMQDRLAHSSMNAGAAVVVAGEIKIKNGVLQTITLHSGHYHPSLFNIYRALEYFAERGVDITQAKIISSTSPAEFIEGMNTKEVYLKEYGFYVYATPASDIYFQMDKMIYKNIISLHADLKNYLENTILKYLYYIKDYFMSSNLTEQRQKLATEFEKDILEIQSDLTKEASTETLEILFEKLEKTIFHFESKNQAVSEEHKKSQSSGRLATKINQFKQGLEELKCREEESKDKNQMDQMHETMKKIR